MLPIDGKCFVIPEVVMLRTKPYPWDRVEATLERLADSIKDLLLDGFESEAVDAPQATAEDLPPLSKEAFLAALRPQIEATFGQLADALNETPRGRLPAACEERLTDLFAQLWCAALEVGEQMRSDATSAAPLPFGPPRGEWAHRYRRMHSA